MQTDKPFKKASSSISQCNTYDGCEVQWFFNSVDYLPTVQTKAKAKGDRLHAVIERYLDVDENHLKDGKEPDLYPENWHVQKDYFGKKILFILNKQEQDFIKVAVQMGIDQGILVREPNALVEWEQKIDITPDIHFTLKVDYGHDWTIEDHKSCKNFRYTTVESPDHKRYIGHDKQLKVYSYWWAKMRSEKLGLEIPEYINVCHNQFMINEQAIAPEVRKVKGKLKYSDCVKAWQETEPKILEQLEIRKKAHAGEINAWKLTKNFNNCGAYGGCGFREVCMAQESPKMYKRKIELKIEELTLQLKKEKDGMTTDQGFNLNTGGATSSQAAVLDEVAEADAAVEEYDKEEAAAAATAVTEEDGLTPIAAFTTVDEVKAAIESSIVALAALKSPFIAAEMDAAVIGALPNVKKLADYIDSLETKLVFMQNTEAVDKAKAAKEAAAVKAAVAKEAKAEAAADKAAKVKAAQEKAAEIKAAKEAEVPAAAKSKIVKDKAKEDNGGEDPTFDLKEDGRTRGKAVTILINCNVVSGPDTKTIGLSRLFERKAAEMAYENGVDNFFDLDQWDRRAEFYKCYKGILAELEYYTVVAYTNCSPDEQALLNALTQDRDVKVIRGF